MKKNKNKVIKILEKNGIYFETLGITQENCLELNKEFNIKLSDLCSLNSSWFKEYFNEN